MALDVMPSMSLCLLYHVSETHLTTWPTYTGSIMNVSCHIFITFSTGEDEKVVCLSVIIGVRNAACISGNEDHTSAALWAS